MKLISTKEIILKGNRKNTPEDFFGGMRSAWDGVRCQVLKLETRQSYVESESASWSAMNIGDWQESMRLLPESRSVDIDLYSRLADRRVDFVRCRPLVFPLSNYMKWEFEVFKFNHMHGEHISCCNRSSLDYVFDNYALHDFMVFDARTACVHDYDQDGLIKGGWWVNDQPSIQALICLHGYIKANCQDFRLFLENRIDE